MNSDTPHHDRVVAAREGGLALLREPFPAHQISKLPKPTKKDNPKGKCSECGGWHGLPAVHLDYVGHAAITDRLLDADPNWTWEPLSLKDGLPHFDENGGLWIKLMVRGVTRLGYGNATDSEYKDKGAREKEVIGDALRNAGMRFGMALDLWHKGDLHVDPPAEAAPKAPSKLPAKEGTLGPYKPLDQALGPKHEFSDVVATDGVFAGKSLAEIFRTDTNTGFSWTQALNKQSKEGAKLQQWKKDYLSYCYDLGLELS